MAATQGELAVVLDAGPDADDHERTGLSPRLRAELLDLDVDAVARAVVDTVVAWLAGQRARSVKLTLDGDTLEVTGLSSTEQSLLIARWVERHAPPG